MGQGDGSWKGKISRDAMEATQKEGSMWMYFEGVGERVTGLETKSTCIRKDAMI